MDYIHYDNYALVRIKGKDYPLSPIFKNTKTRTITNSDGFSIKIKTKDLRISHKTYWTIGNYDAQFQHYDASCYLCGWVGGNYDKCKCKESFTLDEHKDNLLKARRNYFLKVISNNFRDLKLKDFKLLTDKQINELLYGEDKYGIRIIKLYIPSVWDKDKEKDLLKMKKNVVKRIK